MSFTTRDISLTFTFGTGNFGESGSNTVTVSGLRVSAQIVKAGLTSAPQCQVVIYGLTLSMMNQLSTLGTPQPIAIQRNNTLTVAVSEEDSQLATVFSGTILAAFADLSSAPDAAFTVYAVTGLIDQLKPIAPTSYAGTVSVSTILSSLAAKMNIGFQNNGVTAVLSNPYLPGTARQQVLRVVNAAGIEWNGMDGGTLAIWPRGGTRDSNVTLISADTGMVGYPTYSGVGPLVTLLHNPGIAFGSRVKVESIITPACGLWWVASVTHRLESQMPNGAWFTDLVCMKFNLAVR